MENNFDIFEILHGKTPRPTHKSKSNPIKDYTKGVWAGLELEAEAKKKDQEYRQSPQGLLDTLATEAATIHAEKDQAERKALSNPDIDKGVIKLHRDWRNNYYHS